MSAAPAQEPRVIVLGGGLAGMGAAYTLAAAGLRDVTIVERGARLGGLAGSFEHGGHSYPLGYHHILDRDRPLLWFLARLGALDDVRWRRIRLLVQRNRGLYDLADPRDFVRLPLGWLDKLRFVHLMLRAFATSDWDAWEGRSAAELIDAWGSRAVREVLFEPLTRLKFDLSCAQVSAAWVGARLSYREGAAPLGYLPHTNWTTVLCERLEAALAAAGCTLRRSATLAGLEGEGGTLRAAVLEGGERLAGDVFVSTVPTELYQRLVPPPTDPELAAIRYTALLSVVCTTRQPIHPDFYWLNLTSLERTACAIFRRSLNPSIGEPGEHCLNFITHLPTRDQALFGLDDDALFERYRSDFRAVFGLDLVPDWMRVVRVPTYSPVFHRDYRNPPVRSRTHANVWFAGNYRTFPSVASTGTALASGVEAAEALLRELGRPSPGIAAEIARFRLAGRPRER